MEAKGLWGEGWWSVSGQCVVEMVVGAQNDVDVVRDVTDCLSLSVLARGLPTHASTRA
jgi:hypothetical protein